MDDSRHLVKAIADGDRLPRYSAVLAALLDAGDPCHSVAAGIAVRTSSYLRFP